MIILKSKIASTEKSILKEHGVQTSSAVVSFLMIFFCSLIASASFGQNAKDTTGGLFHELKLVRNFFAATDTAVVQRFTWEPVFGSWHMGSRLEILGKEGEPFLDQKALPAMMPSAKKKH